MAVSRPLAPHGTWAAYKRHLKAGEDPCLPCAVASSERSKRRYHQRVPPYIASGATTIRGYGAKHQLRRQSLLPVAYGKPCPMCGEVMTEDQLLDLDHSVPLSVDPTSKGDRIVHTSCNRAQRPGA